MAQIRDEYGNLVQLTDEHGNPVQLTDEHGNPMHLTGVATSMETETGTYTGSGVHVPGSGTTGGYEEHGGAMGAAGVGTGLGIFGDKQTSDQSHGYDGGLGEHRQQQPHDDGVTGEVRRSGSSSSSSSEEDDGQGGRRKKGLKEKIKEKLTGGKHKGDAQQQAHGHGQGQGQTHTIAVGTAITTTVTTEAEKKSMMEKIKDKLPGHHSH
ncbi:late embryogenesis abundant protein [Prunus yedoensis var. nudiflora]|uniref:Late embryogenesis abundant protein n=1 Tax=Prunus yedoensis var. nudiflora TaxID=2094558 RepID=A0A314UH57_PRUYE|nr:late embryogenesis abundant protein [Prunus yedoensis var. nudiflora]